MVSRTFIWLRADSLSVILHLVIRLSCRCLLVLHPWILHFTVLLS